ncbi:hypothetical protein ACOMHN_017488 [Nucella lapillus]
MLKLAVKAAPRQCCHGSKLSFCSTVVCVVMLSLACQLTTGQSTSSADHSSGMDNNTDSSPGLDIHATRQLKELELAVSHNENLTLMMEEASKVKVNFTLYCSHPSIAYVITMSTENSDVAAVEDFQMTNISCADVFPSGLRKNVPLPLPASEDLSNPGSRLGPVHSIPVVQGSFNVTMQADLLGRTWLHIFGKRYADPEAVTPDFLKLPWNDSEVFNTERLVSASANFEENRDAWRETTAEGDVPYGLASQGGRVLVTEGELEKHLLTVVKTRRPVDIAFRSVLYGFVIMATIGMGCKTEMSVVKGVLKKPVAPAIGFFCQYLFMPLVSHWVDYIVMSPIVPENTCPHTSCHRKSQCTRNAQNMESSIKRVL